MIYPRDIAIIYMQHEVTICTNNEISTSPFHNQPVCIGDKCTYLAMAQLIGALLRIHTCSMTPSTHKYQNQLMWM